jgi:ABC-type multidrug transport system ATPase subunit
MILFHFQVAVKSLTLGIERGECFGLLGPNGAGKVRKVPF